MMLEGTPNLDFYQEMVKGLIIENGKVKRKLLGLEIRSKSVVLTNGTFLNGLIHIGENNLEEEEQASASCSYRKIYAAGFESGRMKTGTPQEWMVVRWIIRK
jgi:tRNA uridine 5-carboxymethylaminomethyl modification enzyme